MQHSHKNKPKIKIKTPTKQKTTIITNAWKAITFESGGSQGACMHTYPHNGIYTKIFSQPQMPLTSESRLPRVFARVP